MSENKQVQILGVKITDISLTETINQIDSFLLANNKGYIVTPNPEICLKTVDNKQYRDILNNSLLSLPDGFGLKIGAFVLGKKLFNITTGADLCLELLQLAEQKSYSVLFFEGRPKIGEEALKIIKEKYPKININYLDLGLVDLKGNCSDENYLEKINQIGPDIIFVNFGPPKQENFISKNLDKLDTKLMLGIGGSLDFISGRIKRAPKWLRKIGLEWLWRLIQEPSRWKRILNAVIIFPLACIIYKFKIHE